MVQYVMKNKLKFLKIKKLLAKSYMLIHCTFEIFMAVMPGLWSSWLSHYIVLQADANVLEQNAPSTFRIEVGRITNRFSYIDNL
jgi:hypothetical protein